MSDLWVIKDADGNVTNQCIKGTEDFVKATFDHYEKYVQSNVSVDPAIEARGWRDSELIRTDTLHLLDDYPNASNLTAYRVALRNWPSTADFPATKPTL